jgi:oligopeptide transport system substrate-binding protein
MKRVRYACAILKSLETMYSAYFANQLDNTGVPSADDSQAEARTSEFHKNSQLSLFYIAMNYLYKPFNNIDIREAFSLALNRDTIAKDIYNGLVTPSCHIIPNGMPGYNPNLKCAGGASTTGDRALAQQLFAKGLAAEGLTVATFPSITLYYPNSPQETANEVNLEISMWSSVLGVTITPHPEDFGQLLSDVNNTLCQTPNDLSQCQNKGLAMWWLGWVADYPDPQDWTTLQFDKGAAYNGNYGQNLSAVASSQQAVQTELEKADADLGSDRISKYDDAEQKLVNDVAWMTIDQSQGIALIKSYIYGVVPNAQGLTPPDDWANIYIIAH